MRFTLVFSAILLCVAIHASVTESSESPRREKRAWGFEWGSKMLGFGSKKEDPKDQQSEKNDKSQKTSSKGLKDILPSASGSPYDQDPDKPVEDIKLKDRALQIEISDGDIIDEDELDYAQNSRRAPNVYGNRQPSYDNYGLPMVPQRAQQPQRMQRPQQSRNMMQNNYAATNMNQQGYGMEDTQLMLTDGVITSDGQCRCDCRGSNGGASYFNQFQNQNQNQRYENSMSPRVPSQGSAQSGRFNDGRKMNNQQQSMTSQSMNQQTYNPRMEHQMQRVNSHNNGFAGYNEQMNSYGSSGFSSESFSNDGWGDSSDDMYGQVDDDANYHNNMQSSSSSMYHQEEEDDDGKVFPDVQLPTIGSVPPSLDPEKKIAQKDPEASQSVVEKILSRNGYNANNNMASQTSSGNSMGGSSMGDSSRKNRVTSSYSSNSNDYNPGQSSSSYSSYSSKNNNQNMNSQSDYQSTSFGNGFGSEDNVLPLEVYPDPNSLADKIRMANEANGQRVAYKGLIGGDENSGRVNSYRPKDDGMSIAERIAAGAKVNQPIVSSASRARPSNMNSQPSSYSSNDLASSIANSGRSNMNTQSSGYSSNDPAGSIARSNRPNMQSSNTMTSSTTSSSTSSSSDSGSSNSGSGMLVDDDSLMLPSIGAPSSLLNRRNDKLPSPNGQ